jgi:hypothetical protein
VAVAHGVPLSPSTYTLLVGGKTKSLAPNEIEAEEIAIPAVRVDGPLVLEINHPTMPSMPHAAIDESLDDKHHPTREGRRIECTADQGPCVVTRERNRLVVTVRGNRQKTGRRSYRPDTRCHRTWDKRWKMRLRQRRHPGA